MNLSPELPQNLLMEVRRLLSVHRQEGLVHSILDLTLNEWAEVVRENMGEVASDVRASDELLDLDGQVLVGL